MAARTVTTGPAGAGTPGAGRGAGTGAAGRLSQACTHAATPRARSRRPALCPGHREHQRHNPADIHDRIPLTDPAGCTRPPAPQPGNQVRRGQQIRRPERRPARSHDHERGPLPPRPSTPQAATPHLRPERGRTPGPHPRSAAAARTRTPGPTTDETSEPPAPRRNRSIVKIRRTRWCTRWCIERHLREPEPARQARSPPGIRIPQPGQPAGSVGEFWIQLSASCGSSC